MALEGSCMCGKVRYEIEGAPRFMYQCFCGKCRAASGAGFATNLIVDTDRFRLTAGRDALTAYHSSPGKRRYFCSACGSPIYSHGEKTKQVVSVRAGTLKADPGLRPAYQAFTASRAAWVELQEGLPRFDEWPDPALIRQLMQTRTTT
jgi:hypothetical protein